MQISDARDLDPPERRPITCDLTGKQVDAGIFHRAALQPGDRISGPALVIEPQTTTLVSSDFAAQVDGVGNLVLTHTSQVEIAP